MEFILLKTKNDFEQALQDSNKKTIVIFKHSNSCPISSNANQVMSEILEDKVITTPMYLLVVQDSPELKIDIAERLDTKHESPQVIIIRRGEPVFVANHYDITFYNLNKFIL